MANRIWEQLTGDNPLTGHWPIDDETITRNYIAIQRAAQLLCEWQRGADHFTAHLYRLMRKADRENRAKLFSAFEFEAIAFELWDQSADPRSFYKFFQVGHTFQKPEFQALPPDCY